MSDGQQTPSGVPEPPEPVSLRQSRPAVLFLTGACAVGAAMSGVAFVYQSMYRLPTGELYRETPFAWVYLLGHFLRAVGLGAVGWALGRYTRSAKVGVGTGTRPEPGCLPTWNCSGPSWGCSSGLWSSTPVGV